MKIITFLFLSLIFMTTSNFAQAPPIEVGVSQKLAQWRAAHYSDVRYKLNITLEKGVSMLKGTMEIRLKVESPRVNKGGNDTSSTDSALTDVRASALPEIILDWRKLRGKENLSTISNVSVNGRFLVLNPDFSQLGFVAEGKEPNYFEINEHLVFQDGVKIGENVIKLDFTSPILTSGGAVTRYVDREDGAEYVYSLFVPSDASTAFPVFDQPDLKARFTLLVDKPSGWRVVSNGLPNMLKTSKFDEFFETEPISPYVFAFAAGDFKVFTENFSDKGLGNGSSTSNDARKISEDSRKLTGNYIYVRKSQAEKFKAHEKEIFRLNREAVKYLETYFDFKFPFPKYDLVLIPEFPFNGMEHAGATFLRETSVIFPSEPTKNDFVSRANVIFHEAAHQWFGDTVTMKWFDDLWLKEGFAEFMAYKTLEKTMPEVNAWKAFYERNKPLAYLTDSTRGTTPIYQEIPNLSAAKSAYGNIVYRKAPSFLRQAEFYLGEDKFQTAVRAFLKKYQYKNAEWTDLVREFETASKQNLKEWANIWVKQRGMSRVETWSELVDSPTKLDLAVRFSIIGSSSSATLLSFQQKNILGESGEWEQKIKVLRVFDTGEREETIAQIRNKIFSSDFAVSPFSDEVKNSEKKLGKALFVIPNYQDYGYGIFLLDDKSRDYVLANIQNEKDDFLRSMMWGSLWDSVREAELAPKTYVELAIKNISIETDELTIQTILSRVSTAMNYYLSDAQRAELAPPLENLLIEKIRNAPTLGQRITFYRAFLNAASSEKSRQTLKDVLSGKFEIKDLKLKTKDKFDLVTRLAILGDGDAPKLLEDLSKLETSDEAKRYAYAARAAFPTKEAKEKYFGDFLNNKEISESWIESAFVPFNSTRHAELTLPFLEKALAELPNLKRSRKIFFINGWLAAFIGGQKDEKALAIVNKFLADNPNLDKDLQRKILENVDVIERAVKIRGEFGK